MKILLVGSDQVWSLERIFLKYLREAGVDTELFAAQNLFYEYNGRSVINKIKLKLGLSHIYESINSQFLATVERFSPDTVWIFKGMEISPASLKYLRSKNIKLANYNPDNPFIFTGKGSGNKYVTDSIGLYDLHFTYNLEVKKRLEEEFSMNTALLPFGFELDEKIYQLYSKEPEIIRGCFVGNPDPQRAAVIKELAMAGLGIDLYGNDWEKFVSHPGLQIFPPVYGNDFWEMLRVYRVQLNLMRIHNEDSHNMRSFEIPGIGGIMLAPSTTEHKIFFKDGAEAFLFTDVQDCLQKAKNILVFSKEQAERIRQQAREKSLSAGYSYRDRTKSALQHLQQLHA